MSKLIRVLFFTGDILLLNCSILLSSCLYYGNLSMLEGDTNIYLLIHSNLAWLFLVIISNPYGINKAWPLFKVLKNQLAFLVIHLLVVMSLNIFFKKNYEITYLGGIYLIFMPLFFVWKITIFSFRKTFLGSTQTKRYILIGKNEISYKLREYYMANPEEGRKFYGYVDYRGGNLPIEQIRNLCLAANIQEIYCCVQAVTQKELSQLVDFGINSLIKVQLILPSSTHEEQPVQLVKYDKNPTISLATVPLDEVANQIIKRVFDFMFSILVVLFILSWLTPVVGLMIIMDSRGPIFFSQRRNGKDNKIFRCLKFRTMYVSAKADSMPCVPENDPRVTKLGSFLRKMSIDELPQFINVLLGTMSVVGPRPLAVMMTDEYNKLIREFIGRHYVKPGITGLAQCLGYRGAQTTDMAKNLPDMETRTRMDFHYIENWSFALDIKIVFLTVVSLIRGGERG